MVCSSMVKRQPRSMQHRFKDCLFLWWFTGCLLGLRLQNVREKKSMVWNNTHYAVKHLYGRPLRNSSLWWIGRLKIIFCLFDVLGVLETRDCEKNALRNGCGVEIVGRVCSKVWQGMDKCGSDIGTKRLTGIVWVRYWLDSVVSRLNWSLPMKAKSWRMSWLKERNSRQKVCEFAKSCFLCISQFNTYNMFLF